MWILRFYTPISSSNPVLVSAALMMLASAAPGASALRVEGSRLSDQLTPRGSGQARVCCAFELPQFHTLRQGHALSGADLISLNSALSHYQLSG